MLWRAMLLGDGGCLQIHFDLQQKVSSEMELPHCQF